MKSKLKKSMYEKIYALTNNVTPIKSDCGKLCNSVCCTSTEADMGIYLLPGEDKMFTRKENWLNWEIESAEDYDFPDSWHGKIYFIKCLNGPHCPREMRPLQCRFFPLAPYIGQDKELKMIISPLLLPYSCPLISEKIALDKGFIEACYSAWEMLIQDPLILDLVNYDSQQLLDQDLQYIHR